MQAFSKHHGHSPDQKQSIKKVVEGFAEISATGFFQMISHPVHGARLRNFILIGRPHAHIDIIAYLSYARISLLLATVLPVPESVITGVLAPPEALFLKILLTQRPFLVPVPKSKVGAVVS